MSLENTILEKMRVLGLKQDRLCSLAGMSSGDLSQRLRCVKPLSNADAVKLLGILDDIATLKREIAPIPLDVGDLAALQKLLADFREERTHPPAPPDEVDNALLLDSIMGVPLEKTAEKYGWSRAELISRLELANKRFDFQIRQLRRWSRGRESADLIAAEQEEFRNRVENEREALEDWKKRNSL